MNIALQKKNNLYVVIKLFPDSHFIETDMLKSENI